MSAYRVYATSNEYVKVPVVVTVNGLTFGPTGFVVEMAFVPVDQTEPDSGDWNAAVWETEGAGLLARYLACCLVGSSGVALAAGRYGVFVRVTDVPEVPVLRATTDLLVV